MKEKMGVSGGRKKQSIKKKLLCICNNEIKKRKEKNVQSK